MQQQAMMDAQRKMIEDQRARMEAQRQQMGSRYGMAPQQTTVN